jgi:peptidoglycan LD-endopeptidase LytH
VTRDSRRAAGLVAAFFAGVLVDSWLRVYGPPQPAVRSVPQVLSVGPAPDQAASAREEARATPPAPLAPLSPASPYPVATTGRRALRLPIDGVEVESLKGGFAEKRAGHPHEAVDMLAPRNTPVHAVQDGTIAKLFVSKQGGNTIYHLDPSGGRAYYYAHLERYAIGLREGDAVKQGQVIGYVGTSGNAPPNTPHLHFAVFDLGSEREWWRGTAIDPYPLFRDRR